MPHIPPGPPDRDRVLELREALRRDVDTVRVYLQEKLDKILVLVKSLLWYWRKCQQVWSALICAVVGKRILVYPLPPSPLSPCPPASSQGFLPVFASSSFSFVVHNTAGVVCFQSPVKRGSAITCLPRAVSGLVNDISTTMAKAFTMRVTGFERLIIHPLTKPNGCTVRRQDESGNQEWVWMELKECSFECISLGVHPPPLLQPHNYTTVQCKELA